MALLSKIDFDIFHKSCYNTPIKNIKEIVYE